MSRNDLDLNLSHTFISCLLMQIFRSQADIVSKISIAFSFSHVKAFVSKTDIAIKLVKVILGPSSEQTLMGLSPRDYIPM